MLFLKLFFKKEVKQVVYKKLSTQRNFTMKLNQEAETLARLEDEILGR